MNCLTPATLSSLIVLLIAVPTSSSLADANTSIDELCNSAREIPLELTAHLEAADQQSEVQRALSRFSERTQRDNLGTSDFVAIADFQPGLFSFLIPDQAQARYKEKLDAIALLLREIPADGSRNQQVLRARLQMERLQALSKMGLESTSDRTPAYLDQLITIIQSLPTGERLIGCATSLENPGAATPTRIREALGLTLSTDYRVGAHRTQEPADYGFMLNERIVQVSPEYSEFDQIFGLIAAMRFACAEQPEIRTLFAEHVRGGGNTNTQVMTRANNVLRRDSSMDRELLRSRLLLHGLHDQMSAFREMAESGYGEVCLISTIFYDVQQTSEGWGTPEFVTAFLNQQIELGRLGLVVAVKPEFVESVMEHPSLP